VARALLEEVVAGAYQLEVFSADDIAEASAILDRCEALGLELAGASIVVLARRHATADVLTLDERHFRAVGGPGGRPFRVLPRDAA
jgi:predicted nucleic acid-binding protein